MLTILIIAVIIYVSFLLWIMYDYAQMDAESTPADRNRRIREAFSQ